MSAIPKRTGSRIAGEVRTLAHELTTEEGTIERLIDEVGSENLLGPVRGAVKALHISRTDQAGSFFQVCLWACH